MYATMDQKTLLIQSPAEMNNQEEKQRPHEIE